MGWKNIPFGDMTGRQDLVWEPAEGSISLETGQDQDELWWSWELREAWGAFLQMTPLRRWLYYLTQKTCY